MTSSDTNNIIKIDVSDVKAASFTITLDEINGQVKVLDQNRDSHAIEMHQEENKLHIRVTSCGFPSSRSW